MSRTHASPRHKMALVAGCVDAERAVAAATKAWVCSSNAWNESAGA
jgi:hypothetical protein